MASVLVTLNLESYFHYLEKKKSLETCKSYRYTVLRFLQFLRGREPSLSLVEPFLDTLHGNSPSSISRHLGALRNLFKWLGTPLNIESPHIPRRLPKYVTEAQFSLLMNKACSQELRAMLMILFGGGLRLGELTSLRTKDVLKDYVRVVGKGDKERLVPLEEPVIQEAHKWIKMKVKSPWLFPGKIKGRPRTKEGVQRIIKDHLKSCEMGEYSSHSFRHGCGTALYDRGADLRVIQEVLGHVSLSTTSMYTHLSPQKLKEKLPKRFGPRQ